MISSPVRGSSIKPVNSVPDSQKEFPFDPAAPGVVVRLRNLSLVSTTRDGHNQLEPW